MLEIIDLDSGTILASFILAVFLTIYKVSGYVMSKKLDKGIIDKMDSVHKEVNKTCSEIKNVEEKMRNIESVSSKTWDMHNKYDDSGRPVWYMPAEFSTTLKELAATQRDLATTMSFLAKTLERMDKRTN